MRRYFLVSLFIFLFPFAVFADSPHALTWMDCLREASQNHPDLISAKEDVIQSEAAKRMTAANALPDISADLNASTSNSTASGSGQSFSYGVSGSQLLFDGKTFSNIRAANEDIKAAKFGYQFTSTDVRQRLREAFVNLLKAQELINLTEEIYKLRKSNLELITLRYESGTEHKGALLTAKANVAQAAFEINSAKRGLEAAQRELTRELGRKEFMPLTVQGDLNAVSLSQEVPSFEALADKTPSLQKIIAQKNAAAFDVKASRGEFLPSVVLNGGASKSDHEWPPGEDETSAGVSVSLPLFAGGANASRLAQSRSVYRQLEQQERSLRDATIVDLQKSWNNFSDAVEKVQVQSDFLAAIEERAKIAQAQYSVGLITFDNWTIIEDDLVSGRKTFLDVQATALVAEANWIKAKGETMEYEN